MTNVVRLPVRGRWAWDSRGANRAVRVSTHADENVLNLSVWRDDICVGTVRLAPAEVTALVAGLTDGLAELAERPVAEPASVNTLEERLAAVEARLAASAGGTTNPGTTTPGTTNLRTTNPRTANWRTSATRAAQAVRDAVEARRTGGGRR